MPFSRECDIITVSKELEQESHMVKTLVVRDRYFMKKPCVAATSDDIAISIDLRDTLRIYSKEICGLSANMIGQI